LKNRVNRTEPRMFHIIAALIGFGLGFWLDMSRAGYLTVALTSAALIAVEMIHVRTEQKRAEANEQKRIIVTMLPLVIGLILIVFMVLGALARLILRGG